MSLVYIDEVAAIPWLLNKESWSIQHGGELQQHGMLSGPMILVVSECPWNPEKCGGSSDWLG